MELRSELRNSTDAAAAGGCDAHGMGAEIDWVERAETYEAAAIRRADAARRRAAEDRRTWNPKHRIRCEREAEVQERVAYMQHLIAEGLREREMRNAGDQPAGQGDQSRAWARNSQT